MRIDHEKERLKKALLTFDEKREIRVWKTLGPLEDISGYWILRKVLKKSLEGCVYAHFMHVCF